ncbi:MAG: COX15/CtaA family protein [Verrucomicrobiota bacterium]|jgi:cytochrome c oxidase assembly protein subunit 15
MNANAQNYNPWLHRFIVVTAAATFLLLGSGGMVTSHEAGMSVPDWPNTYGYNLFLFPVSKWMGGIFYEHTHRLLASGIGLLTTMLVVWLWFKDSRKWMRWLGVLAFVLVALQGVLGGLRVTLHMNKLGIVHGALAQLFFVLICALALFTSRWWQNGGRDALPRVPNFKNEAAQQRGPTETNLRWLVLFTTLLIFGQLILGATMRHQHAGLAIPDFPLAYGKIWPDTSAAAVTRYNADRLEVISENPITTGQIVLQMAHRIVALVIFVGVAACAQQAWRRLGKKDPLTRLAVFWLALIVAQIILGAATIWSNKAADVATAHVLVGALSLVTGALWCAAAYHRLEPLSRIEPAGTISGAFGAHPALAANK